MQKIINILTILTLLLVGCATSRKNNLIRDDSAGKSITDTKSIESVLDFNLSKSDFNVQKAEINIIQNNISVRFTASIKFRKPDTLLITVRSKSGFEAGRALITKDTILIIDRINKQLLVGSPTVMGSKYGIEPSLLFVLFGDVVIDDADRKTRMNCIKGEYRDDFSMNGRRVSYTIDCDNGKATGAYFEGDIRSGNITLTFSEIVRQASIKYPKRIEMNDDLNSLKVILDIKKIESPWAGRIVFVPASGYRIIKLK